jgi:hypothetical protein
MAELEIIETKPVRGLDPRKWNCGEYYEHQGDVYCIAAIGDRRYLPIAIKSGRRWSPSAYPNSPMELLTQPGVRRLNVKKITVEVE